MTAAAAVGAILLASVTLYAVLGGADFGGGLWDLLAGGDQRGRAPRQLIEESIDRGRAAPLARVVRDRAARRRLRLP